MKETIASRRFESALNPEFVLQPVRQGADYGTDYFVSVFSPKGGVESRFGAQVKYISPTWSANTHIADFRRLRTALDGYSHIDGLTHAHIAHHRLSLAHLTDYIGPTAGVPTLFVLANDDQFFYFWVNDLFDCYLRWLPKIDRRSGTVNIEITNIRSVDRELRTEHGYAALRPVHPEYEQGEHNFLLKPYFGEGTGWLRGWFGQRSIDSYSNLGFSLYVQNMSSGSGRLRSFNVQGFWRHLILVRETFPYALFTFSRFIGLLNPTEEMKDWARSTIEKWQCKFDLPVAFQILAATETEEFVDHGIMALTNRFPLYWWKDYGDLTKYQSAWWRFLNEYLVGISNFLGSKIRKSRSLSAQRILIDLLLDFPPELDVANSIVSEVAGLVTTNRLVADHSYSKLRDACAISASEAPAVAARKIREFDADQCRAHERSK